MNQFNAMLDGVLNEMTNGAITKAKGTAKLNYIEIDQIRENVLNSDRSLKDVDLLAENILNGGMQQPIVVKKEEDSYTIITGHKRAAAVRLLCNEGKTYQFCGRECVDEIPAFIIEILDELTERIAVLQSNAFNEETKEEKIIRTKQAAEIYELLCMNGKKPTGLKRKWIAAITGYSERSVQNYLSENERTLDLFVEKENETENMGNKSPLKKIVTFGRFISKLNIVELRNEEITALREVRNILNQII